MNRRKSRWISRLATGLLVLGLTMSPIGASPVLAQDEAAEASGDSKGRPLDGYIATAALCFLALFIVGKTARR